MVWCGASHWFIVALSCAWASGIGYPILSAFRLCLYALLSRSAYILSRVIGQSITPAPSSMRAPSSISIAFLCICSSRSTFMLSCIVLCCVGLVSVVSMC
jgi:hypothetical protein